MKCSNGMMGMLMIFVNTSVAKTAKDVLPSDATTPPGCLNWHFSREKSGGLRFGMFFACNIDREEHCLLNW
jgi:hypothetical protein